MNQQQKEKFIEITANLIEEAVEVKKTKFTSHYVTKDPYVDPQVFHKWWGKIKSLAHQLGPAAKPWNDIFSVKPNNAYVAVEVILGTLESIKHELENDYLDTITQFVKAETFSDLLDQAEHLFSEGYFLAAGVIGRAVLEGHLRNVCQELGCLPDKKRPTINDFNQSLYKIEHYSKIKMKQIDTLASIGNDAAHNNPNINSSYIQKLIKDLPEIMESTKV